MATVSTNGRRSGESAGGNCTGAESGAESVSPEKVGLETCQLFVGVSRDVLERVQELVREHVYPRDATIFCEGDSANELFILASGEVALDYTLPGKPDVMLPITQIAPGDVFAWSALASIGTLTARARTIQASRVYVIPADPFREILAQCPDAGYRVMSRLTELVAARLRDTRTQLRWLHTL